MKHFKKITATILALMLILSMAACGKKESSNRETKVKEHNTNKTEVETTIAGATYDGDFYYGDTECEVEYNDCYDNSGITTTDYSTTDVNITYTERMLIRRITMEVETTCYDDMYTTVKSQIVAYGGYIEWSEVKGSGEEKDLRKGTFVIRIPSEYLDSFISSFEGKCTVKSESESTEDVTLSYSDIESHISALRIEQDTYMTLLEETTDINDILVIQARLSELNYEIESYESQALLLKNQSSYGTLTLTINEKIEKEEEPEPTPTEAPADPSFSQEVKDGFEGTLDTLNNAFKCFVIILAAALPYIVIAAIVIIIFIAIIKHNIKKCRKNKVNKAATKEVITVPAVVEEVETTDEAKANE